TYTLEFGDFLIFDSFEIEVGQILPYTIPPYTATVDLIVRGPNCEITEDKLKGGQVMPASACTSKTIQVKSVSLAPNMTEVTVGDKYGFQLCESNQNITFNVGDFLINDVTYSPTHVNLSFNGEPYILLEGQDIRVQAYDFAYYLNYYKLSSTDPVTGSDCYSVNVLKDEDLAQINSESVFSDILAPEPEPATTTINFDKIGGYNHACVKIDTTSIESPTLTIAMEPTTDTYLRYIMFSVDCLEDYNKRVYTDSGCEFCEGGGKWCNIGTTGSNFIESVKFNSLQPGEHTFCTYPTSINGLDWTGSLTIDLEAEKYDAAPMALADPENPWDNVILNGIGNVNGQIAISFKNNGQTDLEYFNFKFSKPSESYCHLVVDVGEIVSAYEEVSVICDLVNHTPETFYVFGIMSAEGVEKEFEFKTYPDDSTTEPVNISEYPDLITSLDKLYVDILASDEYFAIKLHNDGNMKIEIINLEVKDSEGVVYACHEQINEDNRFYLPAGTSQIVECTSSPYSGSFAVVRVYSKTDYREFPLEFGVNCKTLTESTCVATDGCYVSTDCGCLPDYKGCSVPVAYNDTTFECPTGCECYEDGIVSCYSEKYENELIPLELKYECTGGCLLNDRCITQGTRVTFDEGQKYCSIFGGWEIQLKEGQTCQNDYECGTNSCASGTCTDIAKELKETRGILQMILDFLGSIFGFGGN
ncbi:MAG: hypothetical protein GOU98_02405, partial [Candidatus Altiarchaeota archaeon]|nr:hypothetical protein [Candidatus Altiarchaeota archaeon]